MKNWTDIHFAYQVAKMGSLSKAAEVLDVHHSTVLRHVDALEKQLNTRLFHRHARGYVPTDAGLLLLKVANNTEEAFAQLMGKLVGADEQLSGTLVVTTVSNLAKVLMPVIAEFQGLHPDIQVELHADPRIFKLAHGEAHVSLRPGAEPKDPDYVVQALVMAGSGLYASKTYIKNYGRLKSLKNIKGHRFLGFTSAMRNIHSFAWMEKHVPEEQIIFKGSDFYGILQAVNCGIGIAPLAHWMCDDQKCLELLVNPKEWDSSLWLVTHRDMHRSSKVQAFTQLVKQRINANLIK